MSTGNSGRPIDVVVRLVNPLAGAGFYVDPMQPIVVTPHHSGRAVAGDVHRTENSVFRLVLPQQRSIGQRQRIEKCIRGSHQDPIPHDGRGCLHIFLSLKGPLQRAISQIQRIDLPVVRPHHRDVALNHRGRLHRIAGRKGPQQLGRGGKSVLGSPGLSAVSTIQRPIGTAGNMST